MKRSNAITQIFLVLCGLSLVLPLTACSNEAAQPSEDQQPKSSSSAESFTSSSSKPANAYNSPKSSAPQSSSTAPKTPLPEESAKNIRVTVGNRTFTATPAENNSVDAFIELMKTAPVVINMSDYSGFEKVGSLGTSLPTSNSSITANAGDIVLYNGNQIVVFYGSNSWSYTRLGEIDDLSGWEEALGSGDVTVAFSIN